MRKRAREASEPRGFNNTAVRAVLRVVQFFLDLARWPYGKGVTCFTVLTDGGREALEAILDRIWWTIFLLDLDGSCWGVVRHPDEPCVKCQLRKELARLGRRSYLVAFLTGRAVAQLRKFGMLLRRIVAFCQFGAEKWEKGKQQDLVLVPPGLDHAIAELRARLALAGLAVSIEVKRHGVAGHWALGTSVTGIEQVMALFRQVADELGMACHEGTGVVELTPKGLNKGVSSTAIIRQFVGDEVLADFVDTFTDEELVVYRQLCAHLGTPKRKKVLRLQKLFRFVYVGDSAPDVPVGQLFRYLRDRGYHVLLVVVAGHQPLEELADVVVGDSDGTLHVLRDVGIHARPWWRPGRSHSGKAA
ncbi:trehalose-phosphatase [Actinomadura glauciflava]|nr:trehalose-phosphatase [Actinomadura glauciflava]